MNKEMKTVVTLLVFTGVVITGAGTLLLSTLRSSERATDELESLVQQVEALATDKGGELRSVHQNESHSYSVTAIMRTDQLEVLKNVLSEGPDSVTSEYVHAASKEHDDYLRVGVDLRMTPEQYSAARWRHFTSSASVLSMSPWFLFWSLPVVTVFAAGKYMEVKLAYLRESSPFTV